MNRLILTVLLMVLTVPALAEAKPGKTPQTTLDAYFSVLTTRDIDGISNLMTSGSMSRLRALMIEALQFEKARGGSALQQRFFGRPVSMEEIRGTPTALYLEQFAREVLGAANMQHFFVDNRRILGQVKESDDMVHVVVRLFMHQEARRNSDILVYTLINEDGQWKLEFPPTIRQALAVFEATLRQQQARNIQ